jgi:predicted glycosyltransferase
MGWSGLDVPVSHVGYVGAPMPATGPDDLTDGYLLATSGAGHDGLELLMTLAEAIRAEPLPCETVMVAGPYLDPVKLEQLRRATTGTRVRLFAYRTDLPRLIVGARAVVSMAGYNTVGEIMRAPKPALLVPRVRPSEEQLIRAQQLEQRGLQQMLHPADLGPATLRAELDTLLGRSAPPLELADYAGAERAVEVLAGLALPEPAPTQAAPFAATMRRAGVTLVHVPSPQVLSGTVALDQRLRGSA